MSPLHYSRFLEMAGGDVELAQEFAEQQLDVRVEGKIGPNPMACTANLLSDRVVRLDCMKNLPFHMVIDLDAQTAKGGYAFDPANPVSERGYFEVIHCDSTYVKVTHTTATWFDLEVHFNKPLPSAAS